LKNFSAICDRTPILPTISYANSGDQDSVVPLLGSRTLVRELAHDLKFGITSPYAAWFHKGQVQPSSTSNLTCISVLCCMS